MVNNIISDSITAKQTLITSTQYDSFINNIKNYSLMDNLCRNCNTGCNVSSCQTTQGCSGCLTDCNVGCQQKNGSCKFCIDNNNMA